MKLTAVLAVTLGAALLLPTMTNLTYGDNNVKVFAKEKQGAMLLLVKNSMTTSIRELKFTLLDGTIDSAKSQGWRVYKDSANQVSVFTTNPIPPNGREVFFINTDDINSIISWAAVDRSGSIIAMDNARAVVKQKLNDLGAQESYINARTVTVTTDKIFYKSGENMLITGALEPNSKITITIYTPSGQKLKIGEQTDPMGDFTALHVLHNAEKGTYIIAASEPTAFAETTFKVF